MNYCKVYEQLITKRKQIQVVGYSERHHIKPKYQGGGNEKDNIVRLTAREHFVAHWLLAKIDNNQGSWAAFAFICKRIKKDYGRVTSAVYERARIEHARQLSEKRGKDHHNYGRTWPAETREKMREANSGEKGYWYGRKLPAEHKKKVSEAAKGRKMHPDCAAALLAANKGRKATPEQCARISERLRGHVTSEETKDKIRQALVGRKMPEEQRLASIGRFAGEKSPNFGRKTSEEVKKKISAATMGRPKNFTKEQREAISARGRARKGRPTNLVVTEQQKEQTSIRFKALWQSSEFRARVSDSQKKSWTPERREKARQRMIAANKARTKATTAFLKAGIE